MTAGRSSAFRRKDIGRPAQRASGPGAKERQWVGAMASLVPTHKGLRGPSTKLEGREATSPPGGAQGRLRFPSQRATGTGCRNKGVR
jgi:hypothetical protein